MVIKELTKNIKIKSRMIDFVCLKIKSFRYYMVNYKEKWVENWIIHRRELLPNERRIELTITNWTVYKCL